MMKRIGTFTAIAFGWAAVLAAQGAGQQQPPSQPGRSGGPGDKPTTQSSQAGAITLTGCLQRAGGAAGSSASGAAAQPEAAGGAAFILTDATMGSGSSSASGAAGTSGSSASGAGAAGTSGSAAAGRSGSTYALEGNASEFSSHVNKRVQVTGTMASGSSGAASGAGTPSSGAGSSGAGASASGGASASAAQRIKVTAVKEVGGDCAPSASSPSPR
jgi:hypothetical protein